MAKYRVGGMEFSDELWHLGEKLRPGRPKGSKNGQHLFGVNAYTPVGQKAKFEYDENGNVLKQPGPGTNSYSQRQEQLAVRRGGGYQAPLTAEERRRANEYMTRRYHQAPQVPDALLQRLGVGGGRGGGGGGAAPNRGSRTTNGASVDYTSVNPQVGAWKRESDIRNLRLPSSTNNLTNYERTTNSRQTANPYNWVENRPTGGGDDTPPQANVNYTNINPQNGAWQRERDIAEAMRREQNNAELAARNQAAAADDANLQRGAWQREQDIAAANSGANAQPEGFFDRLARAAVDAWNGVSGWGNQAFKDASGWVNGAVNDVGSWIGNAANDVNRFFNGYDTTVFDPRTGANIATQHHNGFLGNAGNWINNAANDVGSWVGNAWNDASGWVGNAANDVGRFFNGYDERISNPMTNAYGQMHHVNGLWDNIGNAANNAWNGASRAWNNSPVGDFFNGYDTTVYDPNTGANIATQHHSPMERIGNMAGNAWNTASGWAGNAARNVGDWAGNMYNGANRYLNGYNTTVFDPRTGANIATQHHNGLLDNAGNVANRTVRDVSNWANTTLPGVRDSVNTFLNSINPFAPQTLETRVPSPDELQQEKDKLLRK